MTAPSEIGSSKSLRHNFLTRKKVTLFSMSHICKKHSIANDWKLIQRKKMLSKRRWKNVPLDLFGVNLLLEFLVSPAPALQLQEMLIALLLDIFLPSICLPGEMASEQVRPLDRLRTLMRASKASGLPLAWKYFLANARMADFNCSFKYRALGEPNHTLRHPRCHNRYGYSLGPCCGVSRGSR